MHQVFLRNVHRKVSVVCEIAHHKYEKENILKYVEIFHKHERVYSSNGADSWEIIVFELSLRAVEHAK